MVVLLISLKSLFIWLIEDYHNNINKYMFFLNNKHFSDLKFQIEILYLTMIDAVLKI